MVQLVTVVMVGMGQCSQPAGRMSTKTGYRQLGWTRQSRPSQLELPPTCRPAHLWSLVRHGTRYPSRPAIALLHSALPELQEQVIAAAQAGAGALEPGVVAGLAAWRPRVEEVQAKMLHPEGEEELLLLGERWLTRLPDLLSHYSPSRFLLRSTATQRSRQSGRSFTAGLWGRRQADRAEWQPEQSPHHPLIRSYKLCQKWIKQVKKNPEAVKEKNKFENSGVMREVMANITAVLGLESMLDIASLDLMYIACNFDLAWRPDQPSPWCGVFSDEQLEVMEYREDLEYYWVDGPGHAVTAAQSCVLMRDLQNIAARIQAGISTNATLSFSHSGAVLKLVALLGTHQDTVHLRSDNYEQMGRGRRWRTSEIGPFASSVSFVITSCQTDIKLGLFINEVLTLLPGCFDIWCPLDSFLNLFPDANCDFNDICENDVDDRDIVDVPDDKF